MIPLIGYADRLSGRPGDNVAVKVSSELGGTYHAELVRVISGDPNPAGPGVRTEHVVTDFEGDYLARPQHTCLGSHMVAALKAGPLPPSFTLSAIVWPTTPDKGRQGVISLIDRDGDCLAALTIGPSGAAVVVGETTTQVNVSLLPRTWYRLHATVDRNAGRVTLIQEPVHGPNAVDDSGFAEAQLHPDAAKRIDRAASVLVAAITVEESATHFNGKIEAPVIAADDGGDVLAAWDFSRDMSSLTVSGDGPLGGDGGLVGAPVRAMTGSNWDASQMCWHHAPDQYGAIHFHDDDIADAGWQTDFEFDIPKGLRSGVYAVKLTQETHWDMIPLFVCPPERTRTADLCVVVPTFTYVIYANQARAEFGPEWKARAAEWRSYPHNAAEHPQFGLSTYNDHTDGSGICHTTWHRPIFNLRPGYHAFGNEASGSGLRHFPADTHLFAWLTAKDIPFDIVTDWELHHEGADLLDGYAAVSTCSHPEYHTTETLNAFRSYRDNGGNLAYLGGNGFYWRVALHPEMDGLIEIRRAEGGLRAWASEPGEYYHAFNREYGGTWRRNARPPQQLVGIGYTVQGDFEGTHYRRQEGSHHPDTAWIFDGIDDEVIGDFGLCGGGAAGYELDRVDSRLGTPPNVHILATSEDPPDSFQLPPEEWLTHVKTWSHAPAEQLIRADMVYFDVPGGGAVFSTGSITFCGALPVNDFDNNVSRLLENVFRGFLKRQPAST
ncbi:MAG: N,N-dimethylformamidase large subunit [Rhodospirillales bacterium]